MPVHLEQHLAEARLEGSEPAVEPTPSRVWDTAALGHEWRAVDPPHPDLEPVAIERRADAIRLSLDERHRWSTHAGQAIRLGGIVTAHEGDRREWANAVVEARTDRPAKLAVGFGRRHKPSGSAVESPLFRVMGDWTPLIPDGESHRYSLRLDWSHNEWDGTWEELGLAGCTISYRRRVEDMPLVTLPENSDEARILVQHIISIAATLGKQVVAEGVETEVQLKHLIDANCHYAQGYLISKPKTSDEFIKLLVDWQSDDSTHHLKLVN